MIQLTIPDPSAKRRKDTLGFVLIQLPFTVVLFYYFWKYTAVILLSYFLPSVDASRVAWLIGVPTLFGFVTQMRRELTPGGTTITARPAARQLRAVRGAYELSLELGDAPRLELVAHQDQHVLRIDLGHGGKAHVGDSTVLENDLRTDTVGIYKLSQPFAADSEDAVTIVRVAHQLADCLGVKLTGPHHLLAGCGNVPALAEEARVTVRLEISSLRETVLTLGLLIAGFEFVLPPLFALPVHGKGFSAPHLFLFLKLGLPFGLVAAAIRWAMFDDHWIIDPTAGEIREHRRFLFSTTIRPYVRFDEVKALRLGRVAYQGRSGERRYVHTLALERTDGRRENLHGCQLGNRHASDVPWLAEELSSLIGVKVIQDW